METKKYKLSEISLNVTDGEHGTVKDDNNGNYFLLSCKNIKNGLINITSNERKINEESFYKIQKRIKLEKNDVLITTVGTIGEMAIIEDENINYCFQRSVGIIKPNKELVNPYFLYYSLRNELGQIATLIKGAVQKCLFINDMKMIEVSLPDLKTQNKMVKVLQNIDKKIKLNDETNNNLLEQCRCLYKEWFIDFNFISKGVKYKDNNGKMIESEKGLIPVGWIYKRIDELDLDISDGNDSSKYPTKQEFQTEGSPFIRGTDFNGYSISRKNLMYITPEKHEILKKGHLKKNDILITTRGEIGRIVFVSDYFIDSNINAQLIRINGDKRYPRSFLGMSLLSDYVQNDIKSLVTGTALQQLPVGKFNQVKIIVPDDEEIIKSFDSIVEVALKKIQENEEQNEILEQLRDTLLPKLINGEINLDNI